MKIQNVSILCSVAVIITTINVCSPVAAKTTSDVVAYKNTLSVWKNGNQRKAEALLDEYARKYPANQKIALFQAVCVRSRFNVDAAAPLFIEVLSREKARQKGAVKYSLQAQCALAMLAIDSRRSPETGFKVLNDVVQQNPSDPIPIWLLAIACRTLKHNQEGVTAYRKLLKIAPPGSSMVHQTFANMLDELDLDEESLKSRMIAVRLEPAPWSADGLALTLAKFKRYDDAIGLHQKVVGMAPSVPNYWNNFGTTLNASGRKAEAIAAYERAIEIRPNYASPWYNWGLILHEQKKYVEAAEKFSHAVEFAAGNSHYWVWWGNSLHDAGNSKEAYEKYQQAESLGANDKLTYNMLYILAKDLGLTEEEAIYAEKWRAAKP
ncbi:MAG: tetratricopeptide repeat protein [Fibrella sp.]|nr:tetratricopeptide repeat protein [Armatimonadota bacterium]